MVVTNIDNLRRLQKQNDRRAMIVLPENNVRNHKPTHSVVAINHDAKRAHISLFASCTVARGTKSKKNPYLFSSHGSEGSTLLARANGQRDDGGALAGRLPRGTLTCSHTRYTPHGEIKQDPERSAASLVAYIAPRLCETLRPAETAERARNHPSARRRGSPIGPSSQ